jgi:YebC/PmpR family DNA-binding regulatory protein
MAGHNKWSQIKRAKGAADVKRGKIFSKLGRELFIAAKEGGGDPDLNAHLRMVIVKCKAANMPADNVERAIAKATGAGEGIVFEDLTYELFGPEGVAIFAEISTDNRNRTAAEMRHIASKNSANIATTGAVTRLFHRKGQIIIARENAEEDALMELAIDAGAEDFIADENGYEILTDPADFEAVHSKIEEKAISCEVAEVTHLPLSTTPVTDPKSLEIIQRLIDLLEDNDDVRSVHHNAELPAMP